MRSQEEKGRLLKALHDQPKTFIIPNPWDAGTAKLLASLGFEALATTSLGYAASIGRLDGTLAISREELLANCREIADATDLPVSADLENCYADDPAEAAKMIAHAAEAGVVGGSIEDSTGNPANPIYDFNHAVERVAAAVQVARRLPFHFTLVARAENFFQGRPDLDDTLKRLQAFSKAGADVLYAPGIRDLKTIRQVVQAVDKPVNVVMGLADPDITLQQLAEAGVRRISVGGALARVALAAVRDAATAMRDQGSFAWLRGMMPAPELRKILRS